MAPIPIKYFPEVKKVLHSLIVIIITGSDCYDAWNVFERHCANGSSKVPGIDFDQYYSTVSYSDFFRINIAIAAMHRLTARILDVSNEFQNKNVPISDRLCASPPTYFLDWFEI